MSGVNLTAHTTIMTLLNDPVANDFLARFIQSSQELDEVSNEEPGTSTASYWTVDAYAQGAGRYQISLTRAGRESPHEKAVRFREVLRRVATVASRYDDAQHALEVVTQIAAEAVRGEMP